MGKISLNQEAPDARITLFADVMLPVPIPKLFTYRVPKDINDSILVGCRVVVPFGKRKILTGVVGKLHETPPEHYNARYIEALLDQVPVLTGHQFRFFYWLAEYYMCTIGEVLNIALPSGLKLSSESKIQMAPNFNRADTCLSFSDQENRLLEELVEKDTLNYAEINELLEVNHFHQVINSLIRKEVIILFEELKERYKPKKVKRLRLTKQYAHDRTLLEGLFKSLEAKPQQIDILLKFLQLAPVYHQPESNRKGILKSEIISAGLSNSSLKTLTKNGVFEGFEEIVSRFEEKGMVEETVIHLTTDQEQAKSEILHEFESKDTVLLHGITGSGKTEIYIELIKHALQNGGQVLYLLPEIALTTQIVSRLKKVFADKMGVYHSKFSANERVEVWNGLISGRFELIVGVRSSILLPFDNLGLLIIDEEHETSYKQYDPAPRYHARDAGLALAKMHHAKTVLGSATPSVESYFHAKNGKYGLIKLDRRFGAAQLPEIELADTRLEKKKGLMKGDFSTTLLNEMSRTLEEKEQMIIFQNRRGYAPYLTCEECAWIPQCSQCAVSLTYHMYSNELRCHYCGYKERVPASCIACGSTKLKMIGFGTEKLEDDIKLLLPAAKVQRMDLDTTRKKYSYQHIIDHFAKGEIDILVGTQMVSKGLDFDRVNLVGIFDADRMIFFPDFRSHERTFQMITQVSGRAGRRNKTGKVIIQTANVMQPILRKIVQHDYQAMYTEEIAERENYRYPPFVRLVRLTIKNPQRDVCASAAKALANILKEKLGSARVLGPQEPMVSKIRNLFLMEILIKLERDKVNLNVIKKAIQDEIDLLVKHKKFKNSRVVPDVDPY